MKDREQFYDDRINSNKDRISRLESKCNIISLMRILVVISSIVGLYISYKNDNNSLAFWTIIFGILIFICIAIYHSKNLYELKKEKTFIKINEKAKKRLNGEWKKNDDDGSEYLDKDHPFASDLDIFGKSSLFQWINSTTTTFGRKKLSNILLMTTLPTKDEVKRRQSIVKELGKKVDFKQKIEIEGSIDNKGKGDANLFVEWCKGSNDKVTSIYMKAISIICPICLIISLIIYFGTYSISRVVPLAFVVLNIIVLRFVRGEVIEALDIVYELKYNISKYFRIIEIIEKEKFDDENTVVMQSVLKKNGISATTAMKELSQISSKVSDRTNMFYVIINVLLLWDCHLIYQLEMWRKKYGKSIDSWFDTIGEFEAYSSISNISSDFDMFSYPEITDKMNIKARKIAHPLIGEKAISNDFILDDNKRIILITGSNMSGKSTFLRTVGINMILSYIGSPVCADKLTVPILNIYTCMRIGDNLEENISSFYAEILRIKILMNAIKRGEKVFFLLDEIFKGTNSADRHTGAEMLIKQLSKNQALGFVSTHDFELCDLEKTNQKVVNYHFMEHYKDDKILFDYKLRIGVSTTRNAVYLMKLAGIEI